MSTRLITLRQIQAEKMKRSRSWYFAEIKAGRFPEPLDTNGCGPNLWEEPVVDEYFAQFVAKAKARALDLGGAEQRSKNAQARVARRVAKISTERAPA